MRLAHPRLSPCSCRTSLGSVGAVRAVVLAGLAATTHPRPQATQRPPPLWPLLGLPLRLWLRCPGLLFEETAAASCKVWLPWTACRAKCACAGVAPPPPLFFTKRLVAAASSRLSVAPTHWFCGVQAPERPPAPPYPSARVWESPCPTLGPEERSPSPPARLRPPLQPRYWGQQQVVRLEVQPRDLRGTLRALACPCLGVA